MHRSKSRRASLKSRIIRVTLPAVAKIKHAEIYHAKKKERENFPIYGISLRRCGRQIQEQYVNLERTKVIIIKELLGMGRSAITKSASEETKDFVGLTRDVRMCSDQKNQD